MKSPKFSIIIPVYNVAPYLRECLDSVLAQTFTDWEAICVDDGSTDGSGAILDEYAEKDTRIHIIHKENGGVSSARNIGLDTASGEYVTFIDSDDVVDFNWLQIANENLTDSSIDFLRCNLSFWLKNGFRFASPCPPSIELVEARDIVTWAWINLMDYGWSVVTFIRREFLEEHSIRFNTNIVNREDLLFVLIVLSKSRKVKQIESNGYYYRMREGSACGKRRSAKVDAEFIDNILNLFDQDILIFNAENLISVCKAATKQLFSVLLEEVKDISYAKEEILMWHNWLRRAEDMGLMRFYWLRPRWIIGYLMLRYFKVVYGIVGARFIMSQYVKVKYLVLNVIGLGNDK